MKKVLKSGTELPLIDLKGKDYLEVKYRIVWFREERPLWGIDTKIMQLSDNHAVIEASIHDETGRLIARDRKREDAKHFPDFIEKATTGAIGRALALCGFGTQFDASLDEGHRLADSPVARVLPAGTVHVTPPPVHADGVYRIPFGKHKGKTIDEMGLKEAQAYAAWMVQNADSKREKLSAAGEDFCLVVRARVEGGAARENDRAQAAKSVSSADRASGGTVEQPPGWATEQVPFSPMEESSLPF